MMNNSSSFKNDSSQLEASFPVADQSSTTSMDISRLGMPDEVNEFALRLKPFIEQIQQFRTNFESGASKSENEEQCVRFCEDLLQEHIKSLDKLNYCLCENGTLNERLDELNHKLKELERKLWMEKESKSDLKKKFEDDENQNQEENNKRVKQIEALHAKLKSVDKEKKKLYEEKQDLLLQYQTDLAKWDKERVQLKLSHKKLASEKELDEIQALNYKNAVGNLSHEMCSLLNLASSYRRKGAFFGRQFISTFDMVFGRFKPNRSNVTFLDTPSTGGEDSNDSVLSLGDITYDELCSFNIILREKLIQNEDELTLDEETFINNSKLLRLSGNLANCSILNNSFENRLLGNETFKLASINELSCFSQLPQAIYDSVAQEILDELIAEEAKHQIIKTFLELNKSGQSISQHSSIYNDQIKFMFKPEAQDESFQEEVYNRFEESFSENYARVCPANRNVSGSGHELLKNILDNNGDSSVPNYSKINSTVVERSDDTLSLSGSLTYQEQSKRSDRSNGPSKSPSNGRPNERAPFDNQQNVTTVIKRLTVSDNFSMIANSNDTRHQQTAVFETRKLNVHLAAKPNQRINSTNISTELSRPVIFSRLSSRTSSLSNSGSETSSCNRTQDLLVTVNKHYRSDGESPTECSSTDSHCNEPDTDTESNLMQLTNVNNLSKGFTELSSNQKLNSTVKTNDEKSRNLHSTLSSNMRLSDDDLEPVDVERKPDEADNESDPFFIDAMLSKEEQLNRLPDFYSTIAHESDHSIANMELSDSTGTKSSQSISLSTLLDKFDDDEYALKENSKRRQASRSSNSKCRSKRRNSTWSPYFSPILSLLYLFYPLFVLFKYLALVLIFFVFAFFYLHNHSPLKIYYTSWEELAANLPNLLNPSSEYQSL